MFYSKYKTLCSQDLPMQNVLRDIPSSAALTPEPVMDSWEEHQHLMNPMFLQSPDEIDLPPLDPELLEHRRHQVSPTRHRCRHAVRILLRSVTSVRLVGKCRRDYFSSG